MKMYAACENRAAGYVILSAYESKDSWSNSNRNGLTYQGMFGNYNSLIYETTRKRDAMKFIRENYGEEFDIYDYSDQIIRITNI